MHIDGQCHCGRVKFEAEIDPERVGICHCTDCQVLTGSPYRVTAVTEAQNLRFEENSTKVYVRIGTSGGRRLQHFCPDCGTPVFVTGEGEQANIWGIRWGSINQRNDLQPKRRVWHRSAVPWCEDISQIPAKETV